MAMSRLARASIYIARETLRRRNRKAGAAMRRFADNIEIMRQNARNNGYVLAVHGTLLRDIDLVAVPWTPEAVSARKLKDSLGKLCIALNGGKGVAVTSRATRKPHGRVAYAIHFGETYIDLSIMPRRPR